MGMQALSLDLTFVIGNTQVVLPPLDLKQPEAFFLNKHSVSVTSSEVTLTQEHLIQRIRTHDSADQDVSAYVPLMGATEDPEEAADACAPDVMHWWVLDAAGFQKGSYAMYAQQGLSLIQNPRIAHGVEI